LFTPDRYNSSALSKNKIICFDPFLFIFFVFCESTFFRQRHGLRNLAHSFEKAERRASQMGQKQNADFG
jgi:hypothetical protein